MRIDELQVQGYKSLYDVTLNPNGLTVLVGPNNAGKSNLADSLEFLSEVYRLGLSFAVQRRGGIENVAHRRVRRTRRSIRFAVTATITKGELNSALRRRPLRTRIESWTGEAIIHHEFSLRPTSGKIDADYQVREELFSIKHRGKDGTITTLATIRREPKTVHVEVNPDASSHPSWQAAVEPFHEQGYGYLLSERTATDELLLNYLRINDVFWSFAYSVSRGKLFQLVPEECRAPGVPSPNPELERTGRNLPAVIWDMKNKNPEGWQRVLAAMRRIVPALESIDVTFSTNKRFVLQFHETGVGRPWTADEVSDGTIHSLALFVALHDRRVPFVIIEEPENSVHPWILRVFLAECRLARAKQVMITTHSPVVLSYVSPQEVTLVWRDKGRSQVRPLVLVDPTVVERWSQGIGSVYEFLDSGYVPEVVPVVDQASMTA